MKFPYFQTVKIHLIGLCLSSLFFYSLLVRAFSGGTSTFKQKAFTSIPEKLFFPLKQALVSIVTNLELPAM